MTEMDKEYFAFISYKREDEGWAKWFQNELESYHLPSTLNGRPDIINAIPEKFRPPKEFRPVFRDIDELKAGNLPEQIENALHNSLNLVVICSCHLANDEEAKWVNKEISDFIKFDKNNIRHIFPFIVDGIPHSGDERECFPKSLRLIPFCLTVLPSIYFILLTFYYKQQEETRLHFQPMPGNLS